MYGLCIGQHGMELMLFDHITCSIVVDYLFYDLTSTTYLV